MDDPKPKSTSATATVKPEPFQDFTAPPKPAPATAPGARPRPRPDVATELAEARSKLVNMLAGKTAAPDTPEISAQREAVAKASSALAVEQRKLAELLVDVPPLDPNDLHAQHYEVARLETELAGSMKAGAGAPV